MKNVEIKKNGRKIASSLRGCEHPLAAFFTQPMRNQFVELPEIKGKLKVYNGWADR